MTPLRTGRSWYRYHPRPSRPRGRRQPGQRQAHTVSMPVSQSVSRCCWRLRLARQAVPPEEGCRPSGGTPCVRGSSGPEGLCRRHAPLPDGAFQRGGVGASYVVAAGPKASGLRLSAGRCVRRRAGKGGTFFDHRLHRCRVPAPAACGPVPTPARSQRLFVAVAGTDHKSEQATGPHRAGRGRNTNWARSSASSRSATRCSGTAQVQRSARRHRRWQWLRTARRRPVVDHCRKLSAMVSGAARADSMSAEAASDDDVAQMAASNAPPISLARCSRVGGLSPAVPVRSSTTPVDRPLRRGSRKQAGEIACGQRQVGSHRRPPASESAQHGQKDLATSPLGGGVQGRRHTAGLSAWLSMVGLRVRHRSATLVPGAHRNRKLPAHRSPAAGSSGRPRSSHGRWRCPPVRPRGWADAARPGLHRRQSASPRAGAAGGWRVCAHSAHQLPECGCRRRSGCAGRCPAPTGVPSGDVPFRALARPPTARAASKTIARCPASVSGSLQPPYPAEPAPTMAITS